MDLRNLSIRKREEHVVIVNPPPQSHGPETGIGVLRPQLSPELGGEALLLVAVLYGSPGFRPCL